MSGRNVIIKGWSNRIIFMIYGSPFYYAKKVRIFRKKFIKHEEYVILIQKEAVRCRVVYKQRRIKWVQSLMAVSLC